MRRIAFAAALAILVAAPSALALTVTPGPNRELALHLKAQKTTPGGDLQGTMSAIDGRPQMGLDFIGRDFGDYGGGERRTQTFSFGNVTSTVTTGYDDGLFRPRVIEPRRYDGSTPDLIGRRR